MIVCALARKCGIELVSQPVKIPLGGGVYVEVDGATPDLSVVVEAYARQGKLKLERPARGIYRVIMTHPNGDHGRNV